MARDPLRLAGRETALARGVLVVGLLSAAALAWAAFGALGEPGPSGRAALARLAGEVADDVRREWERFLAGSALERLADGGAPVVRWPLDGTGSARGALGDMAADARAIGWLRSHGELDAEVPRAVATPTADAPAATLALLAESQRLEWREQDPREALAVAREALEGVRQGPADVRQEARLRVVQLAARMGDVDVLRRVWDEARFDRTPASVGGWSYSLLTALVVAEALPEAERAGVLARVVDRWVEAPLAGPMGGQVEVEGSVVRLEVGSPRWRAVRDRIEALAPSSAPRLDEAEDAGRRALVEGIFGGVPEATPDRWTLRLCRAARRHEQGATAEVPGDGATGPGAQEVLASRLVADPDGVLLGVVTTRPAVEALFLDVLDERGVLPDRFHADVTGADEDAGTVVRAGEVLEPGVLAYDLRVESPDTVIAAEAARVRTTRAALLVAAAAALLAALAIRRALLRQARLAGLKSRFIASVSHELRTPVASILLLAENLGSGAVRDPSRYHGLIRQEALRLRGLVDDVLDFARLERGEEARLRCTLLDPRAFAAELGEELRRRVEEAGATCSVRVGELPEEAWFDAEAVRRAMLNLTDNALRHGRRAEGAGAEDGVPPDPDVEVRVDVDGDDLRLVVADRGPGVPPDRREAVWRPFERLDDEVPGTGLGLSIVRALVEGHGGRVAVRDRADGPGAAFELRLPRAVPVPEGAPP